MTTPFDRDTPRPRPSPKRRAVIMAGGRGTRLTPHTEVLPKPLLPINGVSIIEVILRQLHARGFGQITLCIGYLGELIQTFVGNGSRFDLSVEYVEEPEPLGTAGALRLLGGVDRPFLLINGDILTDLDYAGLLDQHEASGQPLTIASCRRHVDIDLGVLTFGADHRLTRFEEKPRVSHWVSMGVYAVSPGVLAHVPRAGAFGMDQLIATMLEAGQAPRVHPFEGLWFDLATPHDLAETARSFEAHRARLLPEIP